MGHVGEPLCWGPAHPLGGAIGSHQFRMGCFKLQQFPVQTVVHRILHLWSIQHVVGVGGPIEQLSQLAEPLVGGRHGEAQLRLHRQDRLRRRPIW